jgi:hypothetical protein
MDLVTRGKRAALVVLMALLTINVFTGSPLLAMWVGSQVQGPGPPTMAAYGSAAATLAGGSFLLVRLLAMASRSHDSLLGRRATVKEHLPWLRSMRGARPHEESSQRTLVALDVILIAAVVVAFVAFEIWLLFYAGSPIDQRSGRN